MSLRPLSAYQAEPYRPRTPVIAALIVAAALYVGSMFLNWVGVVAADGSYLIVTVLLIVSTVFGWRERDGWTHTSESDPPRS
jgi:prepilin signal peptidase PulO-like enzyme (type II secretory pathway)